MSEAPEGRQWPGWDVAISREDYRLPANPGLTYTAELQQNELGLHLGGF